MVQTYKALPKLDLNTITDPTERIPAIRGFLVKNELEFKSVLVVGLDGVPRYISTVAAPTEDTLKELVMDRKFASNTDVITVSDPSQIVQTFLELTKFTVPHGKELQFYDETLQSWGFERNARGNYWATVGDGKSKTLFVAHLDTADKGRPLHVTHVYPGDNIVKTDGSTVLGADDRAGVTVLLYMMSQNVPGDYLLVIGEEVGCVGSSEEAQYIVKGRYDRAIQFDRAGTSEIITHQMGQRTASKEFARALGRQFRKLSGGVIQLLPSDGGVYTDTKEFTEIIRECTNIAIGYEMQHTVRERQDLSFLVAIAVAAAGVQWEILPTRNDYNRVPTTYKWTYQQRAWVGDDLDDDVDDMFDSTPGYEKGTKSMWEMWALVDNGEWDDEDVRTWVIYNPAKAAALIRTHILLEPTDSLDTLTKVDMG